MSIIDLAPRSPTEPLEPRTPPADLAAEQASGEKSAGTAVEGDALR